jgi:hypothetical protein
VLGRASTRRSKFSRRCVEGTGIVSVLSMRLYVESDHGLIAGLDMYSSSPTSPST